MSRVTVRVGVVGAGWWATSSHLPALAAEPDVELVAVCDRDRRRAAGVAEKFGAGSSTDEPLELFEGPGRVDAVVVATPHSAHHAVAAAALDRGVHVLVEKTLALTADDAWDLVDRSERSAAHLVVGYTYQHTSTAQRVRDLVRGGKIGDVLQVVGEFSSATEAMFAGTSSTADGPVDVGTYGPDGGGGQAHTQLTHVLGCALWTLGRPVDQISAMMDHRGLSVDVVDVLALSFQGGGLGAMASTGTLRRGQPARHRLTWYGTEGVVEQDLLGASARVHLPGGVTLLDVAADEPRYPVRAPARDFVALVRGDGPNLGPGTPAAWTVSALETAHAAARSGHRHRVPTRASALRRRP